MQEMQVQSQGQKDSLEEEMATHASILAVPLTEEPGRLYSPWGHKELDMTRQLSTHIALKGTPYCMKIPS